MNIVKRSNQNPILRPDETKQWEAEATFNGCPSVANSTIHFVYRAVSEPEIYKGKEMRISSIGYAHSTDGVKFKNRRQLIKPEFDWEQFGCEDPRITKFRNKFYIFYTALSTFPFSAQGIKIGVGVTTDFKKIEKHPVTTFNSKAMALFPEKINGKIAALLTVDPDNKPAKICIAYFDREEDMWSADYWNKWHASVDSHVLALPKGPNDHIEVGAPPVKTKHGWLVMYSFIKNYLAPPAVFGVNVALLNLKNPFNIEAKISEPILVPETEYERQGEVANIIFPSGAFIKGKTLYLYYGAADTACCLATLKVDDLMNVLLQPANRMQLLKKFANNPIIQPDRGHAWEAKATFNAAAILLEDNVHLLYRAMSDDNTSVFGYARSKDGFLIDYKSAKPIYVPQESFETKSVPGGNSGCEDPRITKIGNRVYVCYTAYSGKDVPRVALTSLPVKDFIKQKWNWATPVLISPPGIDDKDAALFPKKINGNYVILHRIGLSIWIDFVESLNFNGTSWIGGKILMNPRQGERDSQKIGIAGPPIETKYGWLLIYHGISKKPDHHYHLRAALLDLKDPTRVIARTHDPILEPEMSYEHEGLVSHVVFSCGAVVKNDLLYIYYGGADKVICVATAKLSDILKQLLLESKQK
ncbi:MAG: hypothetical protein AAB972_04795 [Patescibacteria group bacterium]